MADISGITGRSGEDAGTHPLLACARVVREALDAVAGVDPLYASAVDKAALLVELTMVAARVTALRNDVLAVAGEVAAAQGSRSAAAWTAQATGADPARLAAAGRVGVQLRERYPLLGEAVRAGSVRLGAAEVIVEALDKATDAVVPPVLRAKAEAHLVDLAAVHEVRGLRRLAGRMWATLDPEAFEDHERAVLERELRAAEAVTRLRIRDRRDGSAEVSARMPTAYAARLRTYLDAFCSPRRESIDPAIRSAVTDGVDPKVATGIASTAVIDPATGQKLSHDRVLGHAFCALLDAYDPNALPVHGGASTTVVVTIDAEHLRAQTGAARMDATGGSSGDLTQVPVSQVRRMACTAGILPAVLGGAGEVLDLGRTRRLFSPAQRKALGLTYRTCAAQGCTVPGRWCEAHHAGDPWSHGGRTDLTDGILLCSWHHHRAHDETYVTTRHPDGSYRFHRRT